MTTYQHTDGSSTHYSDVQTAVEDRIMNVHGGATVSTDHAHSKQIAELAHIVGILVEALDNQNLLTRHVLWQIGVEVVTAEPKPWAPTKDSARKRYANENAIRRGQIEQWVRTPGGIATNSYRRLVADEKLWKINNHVDWSESLGWHYTKEM